MMRAWTLLILAIISEVCGTSAMKFASESVPVAGHLIMYALVGLSYYLLSLAVKYVPLGIAYALWKGVGIVMVTSISYFFFGKGLSTAKVLGLGLIIAGIVLLKAGSKNKQEKEHKNSRPHLHQEMLIMQSLSLIDILFLLSAIILEVIANVLLKYANGFKKKGLGILSIVFVLAAFTSLAQAVKGMELSLAYAVWGGFGILATIAMGWILFNPRLQWKGWIGLVLLISGMGLLKLA